MDAITHPIDWLKSHREQTKWFDKAFKLISYSGRFILLFGVPFGGYLKPASKLRDIVWGLSAVRDLSSIPQWIREWKEKDNWTRTERAELVVIRTNFVAKTALRIANLLVYNPYLIKAKAALSTVALFGVMWMDGQGLVKAAWKREAVSREKVLSIVDDSCDLLNTAMDFEIVPARFATDTAYALTGLFSAAAAFTNATEAVWCKYHPDPPDEPDSTNQESDNMPMAGLEPAPYC